MPPGGDRPRKSGKLLCDRYTCSISSVTFINMHGWDQTVNNSGNTRVGHNTPVKNLYMAGAWSRPGHGYGAVIPSGVECFAEIVKNR